MKCIICNKDFESKRSDAKYCSTKCRVAASRKTDTPNQAIPPVEVEASIAEKKAPKPLAATPKYYAAVLLDVETNQPYTHQEKDALALSPLATRLSVHGKDRWVIPGECKWGPCLSLDCKDLTA